MSKVAGENERISETNNSSVATNTSNNSGVNNNGSTPLEKIKRASNIALGKSMNASYASRKAANSAKKAKNILNRFTPKKPGVIGKMKSLFKRQSGGSKKRKTRKASKKQKTRKASKQRK